MPKFSRWMPPAPERRASPASWALLAALSGSVLAAVLLSPVARVAVAGVAVCMLLAALVGRQRPRARPHRRVGEDIGTFARALDRREATFDPWVVRAVWDALQAELRTSGVELPLRPGDRLVADLGLDSDDLAFDVLPAVAARTGRSDAWEHVRANPMRDRVDTVADLIRFVALLPRRAAA